MTIAEFLTAQLEELEEAANWASTAPLDADWQLVGRSTVQCGETSAIVCGERAAAHIALQNPRRVLADIAAKRRIIALCVPVLPERTDAELHAAAAHPGWEYATTEGQRKAWDDQDVPPGGEGWVPNVERGDNGWERFDYTEEAYWRRPRLEPCPTYVPVILKLLTLPFADRPGYDEAWRP